MEKIIKELEKAMMPKVLFLSDMESMQSEAIDNMKLHIYAAIELLKKTRLYPPVEDDSIERIEIECSLRQIPASSHTGLLTVIDDRKSYIYNPLSNLKRDDLLGVPMKMILEIPKDKP